MMVPSSLPTDSTAVSVTQRGTVSRAALNSADPTMLALTRRARENQEVGSTRYVDDLRQHGAIVHADGKYEIPSSAAQISARSGSRGAIRTGGTASMTTGRWTDAAVRGAGGTAGLTSRAGVTARGVSSTMMGGRPSTGPSAEPTSPEEAGLAMYYADLGSFKQRIASVRASGSRAALPSYAADSSSAGGASPRLAHKSSLLSTEGGTRPVLQPTLWGTGIIESTTYAHDWPIVGDGLLAATHPRVRAFADERSQIAE
ncbi:MAG: hypothetical protein EOO41_02245, partial [Methanobacteriota archaeon]